MNYIKIKVKHLLIVILAVVAVLAATVFLQGDILFIMGRLSELSGSSQRASAYYDRAAEEYPSSRAAIIAAKRKLELLFDKKDFGYLRKLKLTGGTVLLDGAYISADSADRVNKQYESIAQYAPRDDTFAEYSMYVAMLNYFAGYGENAVKILKSLDYIKDTELEKMGELNLAAMQMGLGSMEEGFEALKVGLDQKDRYSLMRQELFGYYCFMKGDYSGFDKTDAGTTEWYKTTKALNKLLLKPLLQLDNTLSGYGGVIKATEALPQNGNVFSGKVCIDGKPAAYVMVYLKDTRYRNGDSSNFGMHDGVRCIAVTGGDGSFSIENVPTGIYGVGVSIDWQRIQGRAQWMDKSFSLQFNGNTSIEKDISFLDTAGMAAAEEVGGGKFRFTVKMPEEAKYYRIDMGELTGDEENQWIANNRFYSERIDTPEYTLDTVKERYRGMNTGASYGTNGIDPQYLFEPFYHTGDYAYYVTFYDKNGNILYDSNGIYPNRQKGIVHITGSQWSEADKLLLDKKYDEAIKLYEGELKDGEAYEGGTNDGGANEGEAYDGGANNGGKAYDGQKELHALKVLTKLYYNGWEYDAKTSSLKYKDPKKAAELFEKLVGRIKDNEQINDSLAGLYFDKGRFQDGLELLLMNKDPYAFYQIAQVYGYMGDFSRAAEYYKKFNAATGLGADSLLMLYILQNKTELLPETAASYMDNGSFYADYVNLIQEYVKINTTAYREFFRLIGEDRPEDAAALIDGREDDLALLYKGLLLLQKHLTDYKDREKQYKSFYDGVKEPKIRQILGNFGKAYIQSGFGDE